MTSLRDLSSRHGVKKRRAKHMNACTKRRAKEANLLIEGWQQDFADQMPVVETTDLEDTHHFD